MPKSEGYKNLELGRGWNKGIDNRIKLKCVICRIKVKRYKCQIKSKEIFCSLKCKGIGMSKGLTKPMRKGTGCQEEIKIIKRKYYKYRLTDKCAKVSLFDYSVWDLIERLQKNKCYYCNSKNNLGLDRIDNKKGHTIENTLVCCELCNMTRGDRFTIKQMKKIGKLISSFRKCGDD